MLRIDLEERSLAARELPATRVMPDGHYARLSVSDSGTGMKREIVERIFDPFFTTKSVGEGTGMGLSVVHGIVEQHGGFITVDTIPGQGTTFNVYLPLRGEAVPESELPVEASLQTGTERILFVDDEEIIASTYKELLESQGYQVTSLTSSNDALARFTADPDEFDLVITDQTMPEMFGSELAANLLQIRPDIPIILCSGYSAQISEEDSKGVGIREFCMKPIDIQKLTEVIREILDTD